MGTACRSLQLRKPLYGERYTVSVRTVTRNLCDLAHIPKRNENETIQLDA